MRTRINSANQENILFERSHVFEYLHGVVEVVFGQHTGPAPGLRPRTLALQHLASSNIYLCHCAAGQTNVATNKG
jgi:hypothetical protein